MLAGFLRQSTSVTVKIGPFVDSTDGNTEETGLTLSQADFRLSKNGGDIAQKNDSSSATHDELGVYDCALNTTDTNTLGILTITVHESGALIVRQEYMVVPSNIWDSWFGSDYQQVDLVQWIGTAPLALSSQLLQVADSAGVTTLLSRISSTLFSGITQLSHWLGALAGKQAANSTAQTEIRATGAGSGTYDATTDSQEAIRDNMGTAQTGDAFARLGAPAGASVSADVAAVKTDTGNLVTRITSTLFSGITSLAQWLGAMAGKQTANSTARTEIRATGAGSGTFDETTDSAEAIRDNMGTPQTGDSYARIGATGSGLTSLAPASTALSTAQWSNTRAGYLDNLSGGAAALNADMATALTNISTLLTRLSSARAGYLDNLSAGAVALNADMATALTNISTLLTRLSAARAGYLDNINNAALATIVNQTGDAYAALTGNRADPSALGAALAASLSPLLKIDWILARVMREGTFNRTTGEEKIKNSSGTDIAKSIAADDGTTTTRSAFGAP